VHVNVNFITFAVVKMCAGARIVVAITIYTQFYTINPIIY